MTKLHIVAAALTMTVLAGCASTGPSGGERWVQVLPSAETGAGVSSLARWVDGLPSTAAGGPNTAKLGEEREQIASEASDPCSGSRRMAKIRCRW
jgi:outer membrane murein-binding lipoprotein Lpp